MLERGCRNFRTLLWWRLLPRAEHARTDAMENGALHVGHGVHSLTRPLHSLAHALTSRTHALHSLTHSRTHELTHELSSSPKQRARACTTHTQKLKRKKPKRRSQSALPQMEREVSSLFLSLSRSRDALSRCSLKIRFLDTLP